MFQKLSLRLAVLLAMAGVLASTPCSALQFTQARANSMIRQARYVVRDLVVGSPRAALVYHPSIADVSGATDGYVQHVVGGAHNFAIRGATLQLRLGTTLRVRLSNEIEGVWYPRACGWLGTLRGLDEKIGDGTWADSWRELGGVGAGDRGCGTSTGTARDVSVRFRPPAPGDYLLRARLYTFAVPTLPIVDGTPNVAAHVPLDLLQPIPADRITDASLEILRRHGMVATNVVFLHVKVRVVSPEAVPSYNEVMADMPRATEFDLE